MEALAEAARDPGTHQYPSNRGRPELRQAVADFYKRRFGVELDPETEIIAALGGKECIFNLNLAFLDPDDVALAADPGYPPYTGGPTLSGSQSVLMPLVPELGFAPDLDAISERDRQRAKLMFINYPNNPTGAIVPDGLLRAGSGVRAGERRAGGARRRLHGGHLRRLRGPELPRDARAPRRWESRSSRSPRATT